MITPYHRLSGQIERTGRGKEKYREILKKMGSNSVKWLHALAWRLGLQVPHPPRGLRPYERMIPRRGYRLAAFYRRTKDTKMYHSVC
jgi:hypothetical protein